MSFGTPVKLLGVATYTPTQNDADGDSLHVTITTAPTKGNVVVNLSVLGVVNTVVYTANNLILPAHDSFVVTVSDRHGGNGRHHAQPLLRVVSAQLRGVAITAACWWFILM